jgi:hypothetical protein
MLERIKRIRSHVGYGRYLATCDDTAYEIPRQRDIPSPYAYSPVHSVYYDTIAKRHVVIVETSHKCYDVFAVPLSLWRDRTDTD